MFDVSFDFRQLEQLLAKQRGFGVSIPLRQAVEYQLVSTRNNFSKQSSPDGISWTPLKPATIARKGFSTILIETGVMSNSTSVLFQGDSAIIRNATSYAIWHQRGTLKMPKREFMGFSNADIRELNRIFSEYTRRYFGGS
ncbi:MAG: phage virion morphogenesis protein [Iphinoe sp. HA4291-MV1]|nr:phage virion morphogenesis protein [Iphinoe sp. HA4291-MV1]